jgi:hypothetical protein
MPIVRIGCTDGTRVEDTTEADLMSRVPGPLRRDESGSILVPFVSSVTPDQARSAVEHALDDAVPPWRDEHELSVD